MPTLSVIAVFVSEMGWIQLQFADQSRSKLYHDTASQFYTLAKDLDSAGWLTLQQALLTQNQWIPIGKVVTIG